MILLKMFGKPSVSQHKPFELSAEEIARDIEAICLDEDQRNKLYFCLDNKPPNDQQFSKVEEFLKGTDSLEEVKQKLDSLMSEVDDLIRNINSKVADIQGSIEKFNKEKC